MSIEKKIPKIVADQVVGALRDRDLVVAAPNAPKMRMITIPEANICIFRSKAKKKVLGTVKVVYDPKDTAVTISATHSDIHRQDRYLSTIHAGGTVYKKTFILGELNG